MYVGNVCVDLMDRPTALGLIRDALTATTPLAVASANLDHLKHFADDRCLCARPSAVSVDQGPGGIRWLTLLDGVPLVRTAHKLTGVKWPKLSGSDILAPILDHLAGRRARLGIVGGQAETHQLLRARFAELHPNIAIAGMWAPSRQDITSKTASEELALEIRSANVDALIVAFGKPYQEQWIANYGEATGAKLFLAFGAAIDFWAGRIHRAPRWVVDAGAEWAWRLLLEPRRLSRRYLIEGPPALVRLKRTAQIVRP